MNKLPPFEPDAYYHLYNHAVGEENLFRSPENYDYFLLRFTHYANSIVHTYAYCLMPNHFHFLIRVRSYEELRSFFDAQSSTGIRRFSTRAISNQVGQQLGKWLNSYAKAYNKRYQRRGRLFVESIRRKQIRHRRHLLNLVRYIHWNPVHHGFTSRPEDWLFSSYPTMIKDPADFLSANSVIDWFGGLEKFEASHQLVVADTFFDQMEAFH